MVESRRKELMAAMLGPINHETGDKVLDHIAVEIEDALVKDVDAIEPIIDRMLVQAYKAGQRDSRHLTEEEIAKCCSELQ